MQDTDPRPLPDPAAAPAHWIRLQKCEGVGPVRAAALLSHFASPGAVLAAPEAALAAIAGPAAARALAAPPDAATLALIAATDAWLATPGCHFLGLHDPDYPPLLRHIHDPPLFLYARGRCELLARPALALVGSRHATVQGMNNAHAWARALSGTGLTIVSGLARGIDAAAHLGGLAGQGSTIAVLGTGIDRVYPRQHARLAASIAEQGCLLSEFPLGYPVRPDNFPRRNRVISGMAEGVLVVEAALASGSLVTARCAVEQGREVFAMPGSIHAPLAKGCHALIRAGAKLVDSVDDVLAELRRGPRPAPVAAPAGAALDPAHAALLEAMGHDALELDVLAHLSGRELGLLQSHLLALELGGHVERLPGGRIRRVVR